jgi:hypothetical protein
MKNYEEGLALINLLADLVERQPIKAETAEGWFEISYQLLEMAYVIRREAWQEMPAEARHRHMEERPELRHIETVTAAVRAASAGPTRRGSDE